MNTPAKPRHFASFEAASGHILSKFPTRLSIATPLGLGKPIELLNHLFHAVSKSSQRSLEIYTALSLLPPVPSSDIEKRFLAPFLARHFGKHTPLLAYAEAMRRGKLPSNVKVHEFYFQAGQYLQKPSAQGSYLSVNYTHAARAIFDRGIDIVVQLVARNPENPSEYSLSCNPDVTLDMADLHRAAGKKLEIFAVVHPTLPFTGGDAIVDEKFFAGIIDDPSICHELFSLPRNSVDATDHIIGLHASLLTADDGTLQIGIGSLSDALVHSLILRHRENETYVRITNELFHDRIEPERLQLHRGIFEKGLYGTSEMIMDGFMHLRNSGILKRYIFDQNEQRLRYLHGAFFLGSKVFYEWLRNLSTADRDGFSMTRVSKVNDLYDPDELALRRQRKNARFYNTCMKVSILGGVVSDTIDSGEVISGVGGQYNFVAMSHELPDSLSVLMLRSTRTSGGKRKSNIVLDQPHETIPRHLRDVVITEYGIAKLRGRTDDEVIRALIEISDAEFQDDLVKGAKKNGKLDSKYEVPKSARNNTPDRVLNFIGRNKSSFPAFPFGTDFTETELTIGKALGKLREASTFAKVQTLLRGLMTSEKPYTKELERMSLSEVSGFKAHLTRNIVLGALAAK